MIDRKLKCISILALLSISVILHARTDIEIVNQRVLAEILREPVDEMMVSELVQSLNPDGSWPGINSTFWTYASPESTNYRWDCYRRVSPGSRNPARALYIPLGHPG